MRIVSSSMLSIRVCRNCYWLVLLSVCLVTTSSSKPNLQGNKLATTPDPTATSIQKRPNFHLLNEYLKNRRYSDLFSSAVNYFSFFYLSTFLPDLLLPYPLRFDFYGESISLISLNYVLIVSYSGSIFLRLLRRIFFTFFIFIYHMLSLFFVYFLKIVHVKFQSK